MQTYISCIYYVNFSTDSLLQSKLEEELDSAIERREFDEAVTLSDKLTQRKFAKQVTTAFDCHEYIKKRKVQVYMDQ